MKNNLKSLFSKVIILINKRKMKSHSVDKGGFSISMEDYQKVSSVPKYIKGANPNFINLKNNKKKILQDFACKFKDNLSYIPCVGIELEFYLISTESVKGSEEEVLESILFKCKKDKVKVLALERERGEGQFEIKTYPETDMVLLAETIEKIKEIVVSVASEFGFNAVFDAQPYSDDCGSALQVNFSLLNDDEKNIFERSERDGFNNLIETDELMFCVGGICEVISSQSILFAQNELDYKRYDVEINRELHRRGKFTAPVNVSWGGDNRTTAIRIPSQKFSGLNNGFEFNDQDRRIENRVPSANCDPYLAIIGTLHGAYEGLTKKINPPKKIYENAYDIPSLKSILFCDEFTGI